MHRSKRNVISYLHTKALAKARIVSKGWNFLSQVYTERTVMSILAR